MTADLGIRFGPPPAPPGAAGPLPVDLERLRDAKGSKEKGGAIVESVLETGPALPYMLVRIPGAGDRITIRPARIRAIFPDVPETVVATIVEEGRAGRLDVGRLNLLVFTGGKLPGPDGKPLDPRTPVALLEP